MQHKGLKDKNNTSTEDEEEVVHDFDPQLGMNKFVKFFAKTICRIIINFQFDKKKNDIGYFK